MPLAHNVYPIRPKPRMDNPSEPQQRSATDDHAARLLERIGQHSDRAAFQKLFQDYAPKIKAYAFKVGMHEAADELVQEVMINIWRRAQQFDSSRACSSTWIYAIARNARIDYLRKNGRQSVEISVETDHLWSFAGQDDTPEEHAQARMVRRVRDSLGILPTDQRDVLAKVYLEDKSHQQVADELNLPLGTVKSRVRLALQKLNVVLQEEWI